MDPCSIGNQLQASSDCHKAYFTSQTGFKTKQDLSTTDLLLLQLRTGITLSETHTICFHHAKVYLDSAKFGRQFIPGWKLCPKCTQIINGNAEVESEDRQRRRLDSDGRTTKALKFANPGRHTGFPPEAANKREKRKLQMKSTSVNSDRQLIAAKSKVYDGQGFLLFSGIDLCDCLDEDCLGCFYACSKCGSRKCGPECRCDRKWLYEQIEIEGGEIIRNKHVI
ncbi:ARL14 effector protein isoform X2 [Thamnophis elegans]|uniref:ARL14 effector protein isoform X2 n=1 Tax=Thamnophis elegans TaxID=35005 RepID=UPI001376BE4A|nr:ARL14 effector protein isoform X2 [Thamnophis elegans]